MSDIVMPVAILTVDGRGPSAKRVANLLIRCGLRTRVFTDATAADRWEQGQAIEIEYGVSTKGWEDPDWDRWARIVRECPAKDWAMWAGEIEYQRRKRWNRDHGDEFLRQLRARQEKLDARREQRKREKGRS